MQYSCAQQAISRRRHGCTAQLLTSELIKQICTIVRSSDAASILNVVVVVVERRALVVEGRIHNTSNI